MTATTRREPRALEREVGYHDLVADLRKTGCPACHGANRTVWRYLDSLLWEFVNDSDTRAHLWASQGFCREHSMTLLAVASKQAAGLGVAILYEDFLARVEDDLAHAAKPSRRGRRAGGPARRAPCRACASANDRAANYLRVLARAGEGSAPWEGIRRPGRGLCLPHAMQGLELSSDDTQRQRIVEAFAIGAEELRGELAEFIRKHDYRFHAEGFGEAELSAPKRAVLRLIGEPPAGRPPER